MFKVLNQYRIKEGVLKSDDSFGNNGAFLIPLSLRTKAYVIASDGNGWEHVSVHMISDNKQRIPTWSEMCKIKNMFWDEDDCVIQYHPAKKDYVNTHNFTLHLWRPTNQVIPTPDLIMI